MKLFTKQLLFISLGVAILAVGGVLIFAVGDRGASPVAHWKFDEGSGSYAYDSSGNGNIGTLTNMSTSTVWVNGAYGTALQFDGSDDYVNAGANAILRPSQQVTAAAWVKFKDKTGNYTILGNKHAGGYGFTMNGQGSEVGYLGFEIKVGSSYYIPKFSVNLLENDRWYNLIGLYNGSAAKIYLDGVEMDSKIVSNTISYTYSNSFLIGAEAGSGSNPEGYYFNGIIDDVRIYNYARTPEQIKHDYNAGKAVYVGKQEPDCDVSPADCINKGLVGYWDFDQMGGQTALDKSGNGNNGTLGANSNPSSDDPVWAQGVQPLSGGKSGGGALQFDGVNDYVQIGTSLNDDIASVPATISVWVKGSFANGNQIIFGHLASKIGLGFYSTPGDNSFIVRVGSSASKPIFVCGSAWVNDVWNHIVVTYNGNASSTFWLNGVQITNTGASNSWAWSVDEATIGRRSTGTYFKGLIDNVRIYNRELSAAEIRYLYNQAKPIAHWKMDEGADTATTCNATISTVYDYSGNGNHGTLYLGGSPATSTAWTDGKYGCALQFDGGNDYVSVNNAASLNFGTSNFSGSFWVKRNVITERQYLINKKADTGAGAGFQIMFGDSPNNYLFFKMADGNNYWIMYTPITPSNILSNTNWHHIVFVVDRTTQANCKIYVDGISQSLTFLGQLINVGSINNNLQLYFSSLNGMTVSMLNGLIDDVRIYNYPLTLDQAKQVYNEGSGLRVGN